MASVRKFFLEPIFRWQYLSYTDKLQNLFYYCFSINIRIRCSLLNYLLFEDKCLYYTIRNYHTAWPWKEQNRTCKYLTVTSLRLFLDSNYKHSTWFEIKSLGLRYLIFETITGNFSLVSHSYRNICIYHYYSTPFGRQLRGGRTLRYCSQIGKLSRSVGLILPWGL
jgi:hypothetical protein